MARLGGSGAGSVEIGTPEADALVERAVAGDSDAFAALFRASVGSVYRVVHGRCGDRALAEDVTSEAYLRAMRAVSRFSGSSREFVSWIQRIARNAFLDHVKSARVRWETAVDEMPVVEASNDPAAEALVRLEGDTLREALAKLTEDQQEVLYLRFLQDLPIADVAEMTGRNEGAVKAMQFRALRALARILADDSDPEG